MIVSEVIILVFVWPRRPRQEIAQFSADVIASWNGNSDTSWLCWWAWCKRASSAYSSVCTRLMLQGDNLWRSRKVWDRDATLVKNVGITELNALPLWVPMACPTHTLQAVSWSYTNGNVAAAWHSDKSHAFRHGFSYPYIPACDFCTSFMSHALCLKSNNSLAGRSFLTEKPRIRIRPDGACAHYVMVSKFQWKPFWLATQRDPQNDWTVTQNGVNYDVFAQAPSSKIRFPAHVLYPPY